ncbi:MAG: recombination protein O N-terminal domain-containing protein [Candidatus Paceibacterota bacterium]|jgi:recombinational DNA repair protein (RecF pathway)
MHAIYTTSGFIIDSRPYGEAGKIFFIFTRDFGLVIATAQGIRLEKSKLRYHMQEYSFGTFSLVRGKEFWRLTNSDFSTDFKEVGERISLQTSLITRNRIHHSGKQYELIARLAFLLKRLLRGEEAHPELFDCVKVCAQFLINSTVISDEQLKTLESITVLRIMHMLGYIGYDKSIDSLLKSTDFSLELLDRSSDKRVIMNQHINKALRESHL